jgi:type I restriction enzyme R subunit
LSGLVGDKALNANQLHFVDMIVQQLTENGVMDVGALYESPYSDAAPAGPASLFPEADVDLLAEALTRVRVSVMAG